MRLALVRGLAGFDDIEELRTDRAEATAAIFSGRPELAGLHQASSQLARIDWLAVGGDPVEPALLPFSTSPFGFADSHRPPYPTTDRRSRDATMSAGAADGASHQWLSCLPICHQPSRRSRTSLSVRS